MYISWRDRLIQMPYLRDFSNWPQLDPKELPKCRRKTFLRNKGVIAKTLTSMSLNEVAIGSGVTLSTVSKILQRCLGGDDTNAPPLTKGLIPYQRVKKNNRHSPLSTIANTRGAQGAFSSLLTQVPTLKLNMNKMLEAKLADKNYAQNITPAILHGEFKRVLAEENWPADRYPYTEQTMAYESVRRYYHKKLESLKLSLINDKEIYIEKDQKQTTFKAFDEIHIDEQLIDLQCKVYIKLNNQLTPLRISRASLLLCVDAATDCYLGYHLALTKSPTQQDMLTLLHNITRKWKPMELTTNGITYADGACFPSALFSHVTFGKVCLDNAMMHLAHTVRNAICYHMGSTLSLGRPATPKTRNWVEYAFRRLNRFTHRFPSTTGSNTVDPSKESTKNYKVPPTVTLDALEEILSVVLTEHNVTPQSRLSGFTPLDVLSDHMTKHYCRLMPRNHGDDWSPFDDEKKCTVHFNLKENRAPYVSFLGQRYRNACLVNEDIIGKKIKIKYDRRDIRQLTAFTLTGDYLGVLYAPKSWQSFSHSVKTRQYINKHVKHYRSTARDILSSYFNEALKDRNTPKGAMKVIQIYREFTSNGVDIKLEKKVEKTKSVDHLQDTNEDPVHSSLSVAPWNSDWANQEG